MWLKYIYEYIDLKALNEIDMDIGVIGQRKGSICSDAYKTFRQS